MFFLCIVSLFYFFVLVSILFLILAQSTLFLLPVASCLLPLTLDTALASLPCTLRLSLTFRHCDAARRRDAGTDALLESCLGALDLLLYLSEGCAAVMSPYANAIGDLVLGGAGEGGL